MATVQPSQNGHDFHAELSYRWHELNQLINTPPSNNHKSALSLSANKSDNAKPTAANHVKPSLSLSPSTSALPDRHRQSPHLQRAGIAAVIDRRQSHPLRRIAVSSSHSSSSHKRSNKHTTNSTKKNLSNKQPANVYSDIELQQQKQADLLAWKQQHARERQIQQQMERQRIKQFKQHISAVKSHISKDGLLSSPNGNSAHKSSQHQSLSAKKPAVAHTNGAGSHHKQISKADDVIMTPPAHKSAMSRVQRTVVEPAHQRSATKPVQRPLHPQLSPAALASADAIRRDRKSHGATHISKPEFELVVKSSENDVVQQNGEVLDKTLVRPVQPNKAPTAASTFASPPPNQAQPSNNGQTPNAHDNVARLKLQVESTKALVIEWIGEKMFNTLYAHIKSLKPIDLNAPINLSLVVHEPIANLLQPQQHKVLRHIQKLVIVENLLNRQKSR